MFEQANKSQKVGNSAFKKREIALRMELLQVQLALRSHAKLPVIVLFSGVDAAGKGATVNLLNTWMDTRWLVTEAFDRPSDEEQERPHYWRYWRSLPPKGQIGLFLRTWYSQPVLARVYGELSEVQFTQRLQRIRHFETTLADDGVLILKFWLHLNRKQQHKRLRTLEEDPLLNWRVSEQDWDHWHRYENFIATAEHAIDATHDKRTPWHIVNGMDANARNLRVGEIIRDAIHDQLAAKPKPSRQSKKTKSEPDKLPAFSPLRRLDLSQKLSKKDFSVALKTQQSELNHWHRLAVEKGLSTVLVFEGQDTAGKGGAIRRIIPALDARHYRVLPFAAPTDEEKAHHYLWRFWRHMPRAGRVLMFDRSWYGRVMVERIEGFASPAEWQRAYAEINDFEAELVDHGLVLIKYWLHISKAEQLRRFKDRKKTPHKRWKLTEEDWRNRKKWDAYEIAAHDMVEKTSTEAAPWTLVEAENKRFARVKILTTLCQRLREVLE